MFSYHVAWFSLLLAECCMILQSFWMMFIGCHMISYVVQSCCMIFLIVGRMLYECPIILYDVYRISYDFMCFLSCCMIFLMFGWISYDFVSFCMMFIGFHMISYVFLSCCMIFIIFGWMLYDFAIILYDVHRISCDFIRFPIMLHGVPYCWLNVLWLSNHFLFSS